MIKTALARENRSTVLHDLFIPDMSMFNELVIKNDPVKKQQHFLAFMEGVKLHGNQFLGSKGNFSSQNSQ